MMLIPLALYLSVSWSVQAYSIPAIDQGTSPLSCNDLHSCRTTWTIIRSCLATILSCTWVAVHPNIPDPNEKWIKVASRRVGITLLALLAPELIICWATRQWIAAGAEAKRYQRYGWTRTHGFFAVMGGFMLYEGEDANHTLYPDSKEFESYLKNGEIYITEEEIQDRSKGDIFSKGIGLVQTGWFILHCMARRAEHLPLTQLELLTLAYATLNLVTFMIWWKKPLDVRRPYPVSRKQLISEGARNEGGKDIPNCSVSKKFKDTFAYINNSLAAIRSTVPTILLNTPHLVLHHVYLTIFRYGRRRGYLMRVPTFYSGSEELSEYHEHIKAAALLLATFFGGFHCIGWSFEFPSYTEKVLWRLCSVGITCVPLLYTFGSVTIVNVVWVLSMPHRVQLRLKTIWQLCLLVLYVLARSPLLVLTFISLRSLPLGAYQIVRWTNFIPHI